MSYKLFYPNGKKKALTFSYDDGQIFDRRLVEIFNKYKLKATFHLNSGTLGSKGFLEDKDVINLFKGHEVSVHSVTHPFLNQLTKEQIVTEIWDDRRNLERLAGYPIRGTSYPFGVYDNNIINAISVLGIEYSRTVNSTNNFFLPSNFLEWHPTCHHNDNILGKLENFKNTSAWAKIPLFYIWGHSFEFDRENNWELIETFCETAAFDNDVWYATNIEIKDYICSIRSLISDVDHTMVYNPSGNTVWIGSDDNVIEVNPGKTIKLKG